MIRKEQLTTAKIGEESILAKDKAGEVISVTYSNMPKDILFNHL